MTTAHAETVAPPASTTVQKPLRLWPGVVLVALQLVGWFVVPAVAPELMIYGLMSAVAGGLAILVWWVFFSRAPWVERLGAVALMVVAMVATRFAVHPSIAGGMMGMMFPLFGLTFVGMALAVGAVAGSRFPTGTRRAVIAASILLACAAFALLRTGGITGEADSDFAWRWSMTPEERLLAQEADEMAAAPAPGVSAVATAPAAANGVEWPGFRGAGRDGVARGVRIATDWKQSPPVELWRRPVGPGWSSFAVSGDRVYTQEQRGEHEMVTCYSAASGKLVWMHRDAARFYESNGGAGPRGTPTLAGGRVYTLGATGILNALDARDGKLFWTRNAAADTQTKVPGWGFTGSPLVVGDTVVVATAGTLAAYDAATGQPRWKGPAGGGGYSSPHLVKIDGVEQIVLMCGPGVMSFAPADGRLLWQHPLPPQARIVQPTVIAGGDLIVSDGGSSDSHRIAVRQEAGGWKVAERWTSEALKPYFSDLVVHEGHAYGLDNGKVACINVEDGGGRWAGGDYGSGQLVLLPEQDLLLIVSEQGELALVGASPDKFTELSRFPAIKGKTWNHPVLAGDVLLVRNGEEMAAFRLPR